MQLSDIWQVLGSPQVAEITAILGITLPLLLGKAKATGIWQSGLIYGLVMGSLSVLLLLGLQALYLQTRAGWLGFLELAGLSLLSAGAGLLPSRGSGSLLSSAIAGSILGLIHLLTALLYLRYELELNRVSVDIGGWFFTFLVFGALPFGISMVFGWLGCHLHKRFHSH
jgi:hypothetical protein